MKFIQWFDRNNKEKYQNSDGFILLDKWIGCKHNAFHNIKQTGDNKLNLSSINYGLK